MRLICIQWVNMPLFMGRSILFRWSSNQCQPNVPLTFGDEVLLVDHVNIAPLSDYHHSRAMLITREVQIILNWADAWRRLASRYNSSRCSTRQPGLYKPSKSRRWTKSFSTIYSSNPLPLILLLLKLPTPILPTSEDAYHHYCLRSHGQRCPRWTRKPPSQGSPDGGCMFWDIPHSPLSSS